MTKEDLIWMAGFFDGEGCIALQRQKTKNGYYYSLDIGVGQKYPEPLEIFSEYFGRPVLPQGTEMYQWKIYGRKAFQMLCEIAPYLRYKRDQALLAIEYQKQYFSCSLSPETKREQRAKLGEEYYRKLQNLKRRI